MQVQIAITGQYMENYGAHTWDGKGVCPQAWKAKNSHTELVVCNVALHDLYAVVSDIRARLSEFGWDNPASTFDAYDVVVMPNRLASREFIEWEYAAYDEIRSISQEEIARFLATFKPSMLNEPAPLPYEQFDIM
jgi:hypothetical protein